MAERKVERRKLSKSAVGDLNERILLERRSASAAWDSSEVLITHTTIQEVWAKIDTAFFISTGQGDEAYNGVNVHRKPAYKFTIRHRTDIDASSVTIKYNGVRYDIEAISNPEERGQYLVLTSTKWGTATTNGNQ